MAEAPAIGFMGFGEAAQAFVEGWSKNLTLDIAAYDIKTEETGSPRHQKEADYRNSNVTGCQSPADMLARSDVIFSLVTADQSIVAADAAARAGMKGKLFFDCNSTAPQSKETSRDAIEGAGGRYVDVAVIEPMHPKLHRVPVMICGPHTDDAKAAMDRLGMNVTVAEGPVGLVSGIKLTRSIIVKGIEALTAEMLVVARTLGVADTVMESLDAAYPGYDWHTRGAYCLDRMMVHGERRASEMLEAAKMVDALGLPSAMSSAMATWQAEVGALGLTPGTPDPLERADRIREELLNASDDQS